MALATLGLATQVTGIDSKLNTACAGADKDMPGASIKAFTATFSAGNMPVAGIALNLSGLFKNKVLMAVVSPIYDPAVTTGDLAYPAIYIPAASGNPATGMLHAYAATYAAAGTTGLVKTANDVEVIASFVVTGFAIGY